MKKKAVEGTAPVGPTQTGEYITTVQRVEGLLVLNVYKNGKLQGRQAINPTTGEYAQYRGDGDWRLRKYGNLLGLDTALYGYYLYSDAKKRTKFDTPEQEAIVREAMERMAGKKIRANYSTYELINGAEQEFLQEKREKTENNRRMRVKEKMALVPEVPEDIREWIWQREGAEHFLFYDKETDTWQCTACGGYCGELFGEDGKKARHNDSVSCPLCGAGAVAKKRVRRMEKKTHFSLIQRMNENMSAARYFDAWLTWERGKRSVRINEAVRIVMNRLAVQPRPKYCAEIYYNQQCAKNEWGRVSDSKENASQFDGSNVAVRKTTPGFLYPGDPGEIEGALEGTAYQVWGRVFAQLAAAGVNLNYNKLLAAQNDTGLAAVVELLHKGRFYRLLWETAENVSYWEQCYRGPLYVLGEDIGEVFRLPDRQAVNRLRDMNGGEEELLWLRWSLESGKKLAQEALEWLAANKITRQDLSFIKTRMSPMQVMNYVRRQQAESYPGMPAKGVLGQWEDYLGMLKSLGRKTDDEMAYRPRELKRRHDDCMEELNRQRILANMARDPEGRDAEARRMREKFPGAEEVLKEIKDKYEYRNEEYLIRVPESLFEIVTEGQALHHCAGASDRYFDRIMQRETYICFLRRAAFPEAPYYTVEVEPGGTIRQHRGYMDEEPGIEEIKPFLREWQREIKKRMDRQDRELARASEAKRLENLEELKAKNNTRVLKGLMEDFMEAM